MIKILNKDRIELTHNLGDIYNIEFNNQLNQFSNDFATAYKASAKKTMDEDGEVYALLYNRDFHANLDNLNSLKNVENPNVQRLLDIGKIKDSQGNEFLASIFKVPAGKTISKILDDISSISESLATGLIFNKISDAIEAMHVNGIMHGNICLDKIYFDMATGSVTLAENSSAYIGFYQGVAYETFERMVCHRAGKSNREYAADYYALGICLNEMIFGDRSLRSLPDNLVKKMKFENGSFDTVYSLSKSRSNILLTARTEILIRGLLHDKAIDRWGKKNIELWKKKKSRQVSPSRVHKHAGSAFIFNDNSYFSSKYLAFTLSQDWQLARKELKIPDLSRWLTTNSRFTDIERKLFVMTQGWQSEVILPSDKITRIIYLLDDTGPIRYKTASFHPDALGNYLNYLYSSDKEEDKDILKDLLEAIDVGFIEGWISIQEEPDIYKPIFLGYNPRRIKFFMRNLEMGFGIERCIYETNPYLTCRSGLLKSNFVLDLTQTLSVLERVKLPKIEGDLDRHLLAYISYHCRIDDTIKIKQLRNLPFYSKNIKLKLCAIFAVAQKNAGILSLPNITNWIKDNCLEITEKINSSIIKKKIINNIETSSKTGNLSALFQSIADAKLITKDLIGFQEAKKQYKILSFQKLKLRSQKSLDQIAFNVGLRISVVFSYLICSAVFVLITFLKLG